MKEERVLEQQYYPPSALETSSQRAERLKRRKPERPSENFHEFLPRGSITLNNPVPAVVRRTKGDAALFANPHF